MTTTTKIDFVNQRDAQYVASLSEEKFYELFPRPLKSVKGGGEKELNNNEYYKLVIQYLTLHESKHFDGVDIQYRPSDKNLNGRFFAKNPMALQRIHGELRLFLTRGLYHDYDMKNTHPTILCQLSEEVGLPTTHQHNYMRNRAKLLEEAGATKQEMLIKLNTDNSRFPATTSKALKEVVDEWNLCKKALCNMNKDNFTSTNDKNPMSSTINKMMCVKENEILQSAMPDDKNLVLMFDGFMTTHEMDLNELQNEIVSWDEKPIASSVEIPEDPEAMPNLNQYSYADEKEKFEKSHAKIIQTSCFEMQNLDDKSFVYKTKSDMMTSYQHLKYTKMDDEGRAVRMSFINKWVEDPEMRVYQNVDCFPNCA